MALPVVPSSNIGLFAHLKESTSCDDTTNISLKGLISGVRGDGTNMNFTSVSANVIDGGSASCDHLTTWLDANSGGSGYPADGDSQFEVSDFPVGRAADSDGYLGR
jgi:hypothetical protein|tara:strand:- start:825 stop:1142 length:318 start_codon:yes stop_codon:yes gene_type:complete